MSARQQDIDTNNDDDFNDDHLNDDYDGQDTDVDADLDALDFDADDEDIIDEDESEYDEDTEWDDTGDDEDDTDEEPEDTDEDDTNDNDNDEDEDGDTDLDEDDLDWELDPDEDDTDENETTVINDPEVLRDMLAKSRRENAARRRKYNEFRDASVTAIEEGVSSFIGQVAEQIGLPTADSSDPDAIIEAVNELVESSDERRIRAERDLAIYRAAIPAGADMSKLADSKSFTAQVDTLDPAADSFGSDVAQAVAAVLEANPHFKLAQEVPRSGGDFTGSFQAPIADDSVEALRAKRQKRAGR